MKESDSLHRGWKLRKKSETWILSGILNIFCGYALFMFMLLSAVFTSNILLILFIPMVAFLGVGITLEIKGWKLLNKAESLIASAKGYTPTLGDEQKDA